MVIGRLAREIWVHNFKGGGLRPAANVAGARFARVLARRRGSPSTGRSAFEDALRGFGDCATAEIAAVCDRPGPRAPAEL